MGKKIILFFLGFFVILLVCVFVSWLIIKTTPQYSLYQVYKAVDKRDYETFKKYVNVEDISNNIVDKAFATITEDSNKDASNKGDSFNQLGYALGLGLVTQMKPRLKEEMVSGIKRAVEEGTFVKEYKPKNIINYFSVVNVKKDGKVADVTIKTSGKEDLKIKMRNVGGSWQIFDMDLPMPKTDTSISDTSETSNNAKFGERVDISGGWFLTVDNPEDFTTTGYSTPEQGNKFVVSKITYENTTDKPNSYSTYNFKLKDNKDFSYSDIYGGKEPRIDSGDLEAKGKVTGYMTFEIPKENDPASIIYSGIKSVIFTSPILPTSPSDIKKQ